MMSRQILPWPDRFWTRTELGPIVRIELGPCVVWAGAKFPAGYGEIRFFGRNDYAHRVAYTITYGPIAPAFEIMHRCDNPPCVRLDHLVCGTHAENMRDRDAKRRGFFSSHEWEPAVAAMRLKGHRPRPPRKITPDNIDDMRRRVANGIATQAELSREFGISTSYVSDIVGGLRCAKWGTEVTS